MVNMKTLSFVYLDIECCLHFRTFSIEDKLITGIIYAIISHLHCLKNCFAFGIYDLHVNIYLYIQKIT